MAQQDFDRLLATIRQLNNQLAIAQQNIERFSQRFSQTGAEDFNRALANQKLVAQQLATELAKVQQQYQNLAAAAKQASTTTISHPPGTTPPAQDRVAAIRNKFRTLGLSDDIPDAKQEQERLLRTLRHRISSEQRYAQALDQARQLGFSINDLQKSVRRGTAGIEQLQFNRTDPGGGTQRFDTFVTPSGRATPGVSNQFRTFGQGIVRDIGELTKWSIALALVYGPLRKLQELTQTMIENQSKLAEATVTVNSSFIEQRDIFDAAADAANAAGEEITGVIDAFTLAYRAAGGGANEVERFATAQSLLADSLALSKLSTLDQATAIDTLAAALRQSNVPLDQGAQLLDSWVRVTKVANVDLASLATGFAVLGDAADAAQISTDDLNGILAAIGETGVASGRELANTARALVAGFQSDQAREALENIGVAVEDTTGKMRPFLDILFELHDLREVGALDDSFSELTLAIGGGSRRSAAVATLIDNADRVREVSQESARASGDAQAALAKQLETVQTSLTRLGNAFEELAQTLGTEGGFLGIITGMVDGMTNLVNVFEGLVSVLGKATPALAAFIAASLILKSRGQGGVQQALGTFGQGLQRDAELSRLQQVTGGIGPVPAQGRGRQLLQVGLGTGAGAGAIQGLLLSAIPAIINATNKEDRFGGLKAGANILGGVAGGVIGSLVAGSPLIGAAIGTAISEVFINSTIARKTDLFGYSAATLAEEKPGAGGSGGDQGQLDEALRQAEINVYKGIGSGSEELGRIIVSAFVDRTESLVEEINKAIEVGDEERFRQLTSGYNKSYLKNAGLSQEMLRQGFEEGRQIQFTPEALAYNLTTQEARAGIDAATAARLAEGGVEGQEERSVFAQMVEQNRIAYGDLINAIRDSSKQQLTSERISGDVRGAEYGRRFQALGGFDTKALQYYTALGETFIDVNEHVDNATEAFEAFNAIITSGAVDAVPEITSITAEIQKLIELLNNPAIKAEEFDPFGGREGAEARLKELQQAGANLLGDVYEQSLLQGINVPQVQGDINKPLTQQELGLVSQRAAQLQDDFYQGFLQIPDDMYDALKGSWEEWAQIVEDSGKTFFQTVSEIDPQFFQQAMAELIEQNKLASQQTTPFGIQQLDISSAQGAGLQGQIDYFSQYLAQNFPQYEQNPEEFGVIFNDYVTSVLHGDNLAVKLALEKLVDINQKQLDGMYNIPEGATFWVPLTAAYYRPKNEGAGGLPGLSSSDDANTRATQENTQALRDLALGFRGDLGYSRQGTTSQAALGYRGDTGQSRAAEEIRRAAITEAALIAQREGEKDYARVGGRYVSQGDTAETGKLEGFLQSILTELRNLFSQQGVTGPMGKGYGGGAGNAGGVSKAPGLSGVAGNQQINPQVTAKLDLKIDNSTQLIVDGRVLASIVTPYLATDLLRMEASSGTITKRYVI